MLWTNFEVDMRLGLYMKRTRKFNSIVPNIWNVFMDLTKDGSDLTRIKALTQRANKVVSDSPGLVDFAIGLVNSVFNLPDRQVMFFEEFE